MIESRDTPRQRVTPLEAGKSVAGRLFWWRAAGNELLIAIVQVLRELLDNVCFVRR